MALLPQHHAERQSKGSLEVAVFAVPGARQPAAEMPVGGRQLPQLERHQAGIEVGGERGSGLQRAPVFLERGAIAVGARLQLRRRKGVRGLGAALGRGPLQLRFKARGRSPVQETARPLHHGQPRQRRRLVARIQDHPPSAAATTATPNASNTHVRITPDPLRIVPPYCAMNPPSAAIACPVMNDAASEHSHTTVSAISSGRPRRPTGSRATICASSSGPWLRIT